MREFVLSNLYESPSHPVRETRANKRRVVELGKELRVVRALEMFERERELQDLRHAGR